MCVFDMKLFVLLGCGNIWPPKWQKMFEYEKNLKLTAIERVKNCAHCSVFWLFSWNVLRNVFFFFFNHTWTIVAKTAST